MSPRVRNPRHGRHCHWPRVRVREADRACALAIERLDEDSRGPGEARPVNANATQTFLPAGAAPAGGGWGGGSIVRSRHAVRAERSSGRVPRGCLCLCLKVLALRTIEIRRRAGSRGYYYTAGAVRIRLHPWARIASWSAAMGRATPRAPSEVCTDRGASIPTRKTGNRPGSLSNT